MKRLVRKARGLGRDYFTSTDLNIQAGKGGFTLTITNPEKIAHEDDQYDGEYLTFFDLEDIGGMECYFMDNNHEELDEFDDRDFFNDFALICHIDKVELRPEYQGTNAIWLGFDAWSDQVLSSYVSQYGVDKVCLVSIFENPDFGKSLPQYFQEKFPGITFRAQYPWPT